MNRKIVGLSLEKWTVHQLKQKHASIKEAALALMASSISDKTLEQAAQIVAQCAELFDAKRLHTQLLMVCQQTELMFDVLQLFVVLVCSLHRVQHGSAKDIGLSQTMKLLWSFFGLFNSSAIAGGELTGGGDDVVEDGGSSVLSILSSFGSCGVEDLTAFALKSAHSFLRGVLMDSSHSVAGVKDQVRCISGLLGFAQQVMQFHSNRRKLFTTTCEVLLPSLLQLLSLCEELTVSGSVDNTVDPERRALVQDLLPALHMELEGVLEKGLFDDRAVEELASMRLAESSVTNVVSADGDQCKAKKFRKAQDGAAGGEAPLDRLEGAGEEQGDGVAKAGLNKNQKAFHDVLFRTIASLCQSRSTEVGASRSLARGVAAVLRVYCDRSAAMALQASAQSQRAPGTGSRVTAAADLAGMDAAGTRKHLARVFHMTFLLQEALQGGDSGTVEASSTAKAAVSEAAAAPTVSTGKGAKRKRVQATTDREDSTQTDLQGSEQQRLRCAVRNAVLETCVAAVQQRAIPNHDSMQRYVQRLHSLSAAALQDRPAAEELALNMHCVRLVATIDHGTVVEQRLPSVLQLLAGTTVREGSESLLKAGTQLFEAVAQVHGDLRLMDQLVSETVRAGAQASAQSGLSLLEMIVRSSTTSALMVRLLTGIPSGQGPRLWSCLVQPETVEVGVVACHLARALMRAQLRTVRTSASVHLGERGADSMDVDPLVQHATQLLGQLTASLQSGMTATAVPAILEVTLDTASELVRFMTHYCSGAAQQLLSAGTTQSEAGKGSHKDGPHCFFYIACGPMLNTLVALRKQPGAWLSKLGVALSLLLLCANVCVKVPTAASQYAAQVQVARSLANKLLSAADPASAAAHEGNALELLMCLLSQVRIWSQLSEGGETSPVGGMSALFRAYLSAALESHTLLADDVAEVRRLLESAVVQDSTVVKLAVNVALREHWAALATRSKSGLTDKAHGVLSLTRAFPLSLLISASFLMPALRSHMQQALSAEADPLLLESAEVAAAVLLGYLRAAPHSRVCSSLQLGGDRTGAQERHQLALSTVLECLGMKEGCTAQALQAAVQALFPLLERVAQIPDRVEESTAFLAHCLDVLLTAALQQGDNEALTTTLSSLSTVLQTGCSGQTRSCPSTRTLLRTVLNTLLAQPSAAAAHVGALEELLSALVRTCSTAVSSESSGDASANRVKGKRGTAKQLAQPGQVSIPTVCSDERFFYIAEVAETLKSVCQRAGALTAATCGLSDAQVTALVSELLQAAAAAANSSDSVPSASNGGREGWLRLFAVLAGPIVHQTGVVVLAHADAEEGSVPLTAVTARVDVTRLQSLFSLLNRMLGTVRSQDAEQVAVASTAVISLVVAVLQYVLCSRVCSCEVSEMLAALRSGLLTPEGDDLQQGDLHLVLLTDLLAYCTEHGRVFFANRSPTAAERFASFHAELTSMVSSVLQETVAGSAVTCAEGVRRITRVLELAHAVTTSAVAVLHKQSRGARGGGGGGRRKAPRRDGEDSRTAVFRFDHWCDGLLQLLALAASHMHLWRASAAGYIAQEENAQTVLLAKATLLVMDRVISVCTANSLPNLNTAVGVLCTVLTSTITLLLNLEAKLDSSCSTGAPTSGHRAVRQQLASCHHLLCRVCGGIGSSAVLEKHIHFLASAVVECLARSTVTRQFQELAYPGIYALFERCQSRQKTQMFAMLDPQSRVLMSDLHGEFMRSYKFVGK